MTRGEEPTGGRARTQDRPDDAATARTGAPARGRTDAEVVRPHRRLRHRLTLLGLLIGLAAIVASSDALFLWFDGMVTALEPVMLRHPVTGAIIFAALASISAFMAFFSSTILVPVAVHAWGAPVTIGLLWGGWIVGGAVAYGLGRWVGRPVARSLAGAERLAYYEARLTDRAPFTLILLLHLALQSEIPGLVLGVLRYRFERFLLALGLAELPYAVGVVYLGRFFLERQTGLLVAVAAGLVAAAAWVFHLLHQTLERGDPPEGSASTP
jgi:uncharacterized membrane protein YdjX (TVP38/TMEM64 family)